MTPIKTLDLKGNFRTYPFAELIVEISQAKLSGSLRLACGEKKTVVYFRDGALVYGVSNAKALRLFTILLFLSDQDFTGHYFHPHILAITHLMALGWATMIIFGASHQLVPVLIESDLHSNTLAYASFALAGLGIPLLVYGFFAFNLGWPAQVGGSLVLGAILAFIAEPARK